MTLFQILAIVVLVCLFVLTVFAMLRGWATRRDAFIWTMVWLAAAIAIVWPQSTVVIARMLGIGRGADLILYCSVVVMLIGFLMVYVRLRRIRREMTLLVRRLALRDALIRQPDVGRGGVP
jgi:hypothetical protein